MNDTARALSLLTIAALGTLAGCATAQVEVPQPWACAMSGDFAKNGDGTWTQVVTENSGPSTLRLRRDLTNSGDGTVVLEVRDAAGTHVERLELGRGGHAESTFDVPPGGVVRLQLVPPPDARGWYEFECRVAPLSAD